METLAMCAARLAYEWRVFFDRTSQGWQSPAVCPGSLDRKLFVPKMYAKGLRSRY